MNTLIIIITISITITSSQILRWDNGIIPYKINQNITYPNQILDGIKYISDVTNVRFRERTNEKDYIEYANFDGTKDKGCWSLIGKQGGLQYISIGDGCDTGTIIHETAHAIGILHEQSRNDRDKYVKINFENIQENKTINFEKSKRIPEDLTYDFDSIMHYGQWDFSNNTKKTIELKIKTNVCFIGQSFKLSSNDISHINNLIGYKANTKEVHTNNNVLFCGGRNIRTFSHIFTEYEKIGNTYRSKWSFQNDYKIIKYNILSLRWEITYKGKLYAYNDKDLESNDWLVYDLNTDSFIIDSSNGIKNINNYNKIQTISFNSYIIFIPILLFFILVILCCCIRCLW